MQAPMETGLLTLTMLGDALEPLAFLLFAAALVVIGLLAGQLVCLLVLFRRHRESGSRGDLAAEAYLLPADLPHVLIQLPTFNEPAVVGRALEAAAALDWPRDRLHIQILDDSTDETTEIARARAADLKAQGFHVDVLHRTSRAGFKAGALAAGLTRSAAPFVAIFDADFVPPPNYLRRTVPLLLADDRLAFVQGRWQHLNAGESLLTRAQSLSLDAHFVVEQSARSWSGLPMSFNGSGGIWRRAAIEDAGGWQYDTLTEDLDLSCRALLKGWRSRFLRDLDVPGELPETVTAWRDQQFRWTKGFAQCARKLLPAIWGSADLPFAHKLAITAQFLQGWVYPAGAMALMMALILIALHGGMPRTEIILGLLSSTSGLMAVVAIIATARWDRGYPLDGATIVGIAAVLALNSGLALSNSRAIYEALIGRQSAFVRTPKRGNGALVKSQQRAVQRHWRSGFPEVALAVFAVSIALAYNAWYSPFLLLTVTGLTVVGTAGLAGARDR